MIYSLVVKRQIGKAFTISSERFHVRSNFVALLRMVGYNTVNWEGVYYVFRAFLRPYQFCRDV